MIELGGAAATALALLLNAAASPVAVESSTSCPAAAEVEARLAALLPPPPPGAGPERATITAEAGTLRITLVGADGAAIGERSLSLDVSCADRANVVAVVIAAWEAQQRPELLPAPALPRAQVARQAPPPPPASAPTVELAVGPAVTLAGGALAAAGLVTATVWGRSLGLHLALRGAWPRQQALGDGQARWTRVGAEAGLGHRTGWRQGTVRLDLHAAVVGALLAAQGQGFDLDRADRGFSPGAAVGAALSRTFGRLVLGLAVGGTGWFLAQRLVSSSTVMAAEPLPRLELSLSAGLGVIL